MLFKKLVNIAVAGAAYATPRTTHRTGTKMTIDIDAGSTPTNAEGGGLGAYSRAVATAKSHYLHVIDLIRYGAFIGRLARAISLGARPAAA